MIRLLLRANKKLMSLAAADPSLAAAAADSSSGAKEDLRRVADSYGKTAGRLAWDMQRWAQHLKASWGKDCRGGGGRTP